MSRYDEVDPDDLTPAQQAVADAIAGGPRGSLRGPFVPWLLSPGMADPAQRLGAFLRFGTVVPERLKELAIVFTARWWDAGFEWSVHAKLALDAGLPRDIVEAIGRGDTPEFADPDEALIYRACREMYETRRFSDANFAALKTLLGPQGVAELAGLLGYYALVSITLNAFEVAALEDEAVPAPAPRQSLTCDSNMPSFKGNDGNLMQHWVLCELLATARRYTTDLTFIDAHAMAPSATRRTAKPKQRGKFDAVLENLSGQGSVYEQAWQALALRPGTYPNSASFVRRIWPADGQCSMLLCEIDEWTLCELRSWADIHGDTGIEIALGDWRPRFAERLPKQRGVVLVSFDPYLISKKERKSRESGKMYPEDLDRLVEATRPYKQNILLQLSTYSSNGGNTQPEVEVAIRSKLEPACFKEVAIVRPNKAMMSLVYQRGVDFSAELTSISSRFDNWFRAIRGDSAP